MKNKRNRSKKSSDDSAPNAKLKVNQHNLDKKTICFLIQTRVHFNESVKMANSLNQFYNIFFLFGVAPEKLKIESNIPYDSLYIKDIHLNLKATGSDLYNVKANNLPQHITQNPVKPFLVVGTGSFIKQFQSFSRTVFIELCRNKYFSAMANFNIRLINTVMNALYKYRRLKSQAFEFFSKSEIDILILNEANVEWCTEIFIKACKASCIPTIIIPYTLSSQSEPAQAYFNCSLHQYPKALDIFLKDYFQKWVYEFQAKRLLRIPLLDIISQKKLGIAPPLPWVQESSSADVLVAESKVTSKHSISQGIPRTQIYEIGNINFDILYEAYQRKNKLKKEILQELGYSLTKKKTLTFAIFPNLFYYKGDQMEFSSYDKALRYILRQLSKISHFNIILSLHPSIRKESLILVELEGLRISTRCTAELIAISDIYIASISSTIKWAIALGIPVINYDVYKLRYNDYISAKGVINIETKKEFKKALRQLTQDDIYYESLKRKQKINSKLWGIIDGEFTNRLVKLINKLIKNRKKQ